MEFLNAANQRPESDNKMYETGIKQNCLMAIYGTNYVRSKAEETRSTQRAQTSLAEADHYSHFAHCKNVEPWW